MEAVLWLAVRRHDKPVACSKLVNVNLDALSADDVFAGEPPKTGKFVTVLTQIHRFCAGCSEIRGFEDRYFLRCFGHFWVLFSKIGKKPGKSEAKFAGLSADGVVEEWGVDGTFLESFEGVKD